jgi:hypothetical protein
MKALFNFDCEVPHTQSFLLCLDSSADVCKILYLHTPEGNWYEALLRIHEYNIPSLIQSHPSNISKYQNLAANSWRDKIFL